MIQPLVELYGGCVVVLKVSWLRLRPQHAELRQLARQGAGDPIDVVGDLLRRLGWAFYDPTFSRTVWRLCGGAKGLAAAALKSLTEAPLGRSSQRSGAA